MRHSAVGQACKNSCLPYSKTCFRLQTRGKNFNWSLRGEGVHGVLFEVLTCFDIVFFPKTSGSSTVMPFAVVYLLFE